MYTRIFCCALFQSVASLPPLVSLSSSCTRTHTHGRGGQQQNRIRKRRRRTVCVFFIHFGSPWLRAHEKLYQVFIYCCAARRDERVYIVCALLKAKHFSSFETEFFIRILLLVCPSFPSKVRWRTAVSEHLCTIDDNTRSKFTSKTKNRKKRRKLEITKKSCIRVHQTNSNEWRSLYALHH